MTEQHAIDTSSGVRLIGGEVMTEDFSRLSRPGAIAYLLHSVLGEHPGRVALIGPHAATLVDVVRPDRPVDILVRSLVDARELASHAQERQHLRVFAGGFERFKPGAPYDVVVNLDGPQGLLTPDSTPLTYAETIKRSGEFLGDRGRAIVAVANDLAMDHVFRLEMRTLFDDDTSWHRGADEFESRNPLYPELPEIVSAAGLSIDRLYSGYPIFNQMSLLVDPAIAEDSTGRAGLESLIAKIESDQAHGHRSLIDLYSMSRRFLAAGLGPHTAAGWVVEARKGEASSETATADRPQLLQSEDGVSPQWSGIMTASQDADGWERSILPLHHAGPMFERRVSRDLSLVGGRLPSGDLLEAALRAECARGNLTGVRRLTRDYAAFLSDDAVWRDGGLTKRFFAGPNNVVLGPDGSMELFDESWSWTEDLDADLCLARGLREFARRLLQSGGEHPWQPDISPDALTQTLLAMVGKPWSPDVASQIASREAELSVVIHGGGATTESQLLAENLANGASQFTATSSPSRGYREAMSSLGRMSQELHTRGDQVTWLESAVRQRDQSVRDLERRLARLQSSPSYVLGRRLTAPGRRVGERVVTRAKRTAFAIAPPQRTAQLERVLTRLGI
ncbi:hypothetical protein [Demetria terragena]|uniref:hypothetical protein n=1 Tax=Demetria terragena TaxID=63959 RepID=UPI0003808BE5|nr:hypothetical protein [Demetria terragena]